MDGTTLERPFTTEQCNEFPTKGFYACVRCKTPVAAAINKIGIEGGISAFQRLNTVDTEVRVVSGEYSSRLQVSCKKCRGNLGEISQDVPPRAKCETGEVFKAYSICLQFVDGPATSVLQGNFCAADDDCDGDIDDDFAMDYGMIGGSNAKKTAPSSSSTHNKTAMQPLAVQKLQDRHNIASAINEYSDDDSPRVRGPGEPSSDDDDDEDEGSF